MDKSKTHYIFVKELLAWFDANRRDLPWRRNKNAYYIWVSEIMLQQTQVKTVIPYFERFIARFPTIDALAEADEEEVLKYWEGLGYYSRARNLHSAVREVQETYGSVVPCEPEKIRQLKGVGPYTAGAILSIAYNKPEPAVDGNVMRVLSRFYLIEDDIACNRTRVAMERLVRELIPHDRAGDFNEALMEFGALVCTPKAPRCAACPLEEWCAAKANGLELTLPIKKKAKPPRLERRVVALIEGSGEQEGKILIRQRPQEGLLARMWELPHVELDPSVLSAERADSSDIMEFTWQVTQLDRYLKEQIGVQLQDAVFFTDITHVFSHIRWEMSVYLCKLNGDAAERALVNESGYEAGVGAGSDPSGGDCSDDSADAGVGAVADASDGDCSDDGAGSDAGADASERESSDASDNASFGANVGVGTVDSGLTYRWIALDERDDYPFPNVFVRLMEQYEQSAWVYVDADD